MILLVNFSIMKIRNHKFSDPISIFLVNYFFLMYVKLEAKYKGRCYEV